MKKTGRPSLNLTIDEKLAKAAQKVAEKKGVTRSRLVEKYFEFLVSQSVYCFNCGEKFAISKSRIHSECGWAVCPKCGACRCSLSDKEAAIAFQFRKTLDELAGGRVGE